MRPAPSSGFSRSETRRAQSNGVRSSDFTLSKMYDSICSLENGSRKMLTTQVLEEALRLLGKRERSFRERMITIAADRALTASEIAEYILENWSNKSTGADLGTQRRRVCLWQDKNFVYAEFSSPYQKNAFLDMVTGAASKQPSPLKNLIQKPDANSGLHYNRKLIKIEIMNVPASVDLETVKLLILSDAHQHCAFTDFRDGQLHTSKRLRSVVFKVNNHGFRHLFEVMEGCLPLTLQTRPRIKSTKLAFRVNCKVWTCNHCHGFSNSTENEDGGSFVGSSSTLSRGSHQCRGRLCARCSSKRHSTRDCRESNRYCINCSRTGHRARDVNCPAYLHAVANEIKKADIPLEYLEDDDLRFLLLKSLCIK